VPKIRRKKIMIKKLFKNERKKYDKKNENIFNFYEKKIWNELYFYLKNCGKIDLKSKYENEILKIDKFSNKLRDKKEILVLI
jgi:arginine decarboxylase-like protein